MAEVFFKDERSIGELLGGLASETGTLVRQEVALAQAELSSKAAKVGRNIAFLLVGGAVAFAAALALMASVVFALSAVLPAWAAALIVAVLVGIAAFAMISAGLTNLSKTEITPRQSVESIKEDAQWLKNQVS